MTTERDVTRIVRSWIRGDEHESADRVLGIVLDQLDTTPQRRSTWWPARRTPTMNKFATIALGAAAVVVALFVGVQLLGSSGGGTGGQSSPTPTATPDATPEPTPSPSVDAGLPVGSTHTLSDEGLVTKATIPAPGWSVDSGSLVNTSGSPEDLDGAYVIGPWLTADPFVPGDPCQWVSTMPDTPATTLDEIVAALGSQATRNASAPVDVTVDGYAGKVITIEMPDGPHSASLNPDCDEDILCTLGFGDPVDCQMWFQEAGQIDELWIVDVDGEFLFVPGSYFPETPASVVDELGAFLGSMTFGE